MVNVISSKVLFHNFFHGIRSYSVYNRVSTNVNRLVWDGKKIVRHIPFVKA